jgi:hypothetical protein
MVPAEPAGHSGNVTTYPQASSTSTASAVRWLASLGVAMLASAVVTASAQASGDFRWWALFVLIPGALITASGAVVLTRGRAASLAGYLVACLGALVFATGAILMFGAMPRMWPLMIVLPALAIAGSYAWRPEDPLARAFHRTIALLALAAVALGLTFLADSLGAVELSGQRWWPWYMIVAGAIVVANGAELVRHRMAYRVSAAVLAAGPGIVAILLGIRFLRDWPINW